MESVWFAIVAGMLTVYAVLDGFDFGVGIIYRIVARTAEEREAALAAIGPIWDANEVWLIAAGGVLFTIFPSVYATAFSGFYLALIVVLWLLILRGIAIEFRLHQDHTLWREFWDTVFSLSSALLAVVFGATLGNLIRGVPLDQEGLRGMPLFTNFLTSSDLGILDWYTGLVGAFTLVVLAVHGALFLAWRTTGPLRERSLALAREGWKFAIALWVTATIATAWIRPDFFSGFASHPWTVLPGTAAIAGGWGVFYFSRQNQELAAFASSSTFLFATVAATFAGQHPFWLRSTIAPSYSLTAFNAASARYAMNTALIWWCVGITLVICYFTFLFRWMCRKVGDSN